MEIISLSSPKRWLAAQQDAIKAWLSIALDSLKLAGLAGSALGLYLTLSYLLSVNAPVFLDASSAFALILIALLFGFCCLIFTGILFYPLIFCRGSARSRRLVIFADASSSRSIAARLGGNHYLLLQSSPIGLIATLTVSSLAFSASTETVLLASTIGAVVGLAVSITVLLASPFKEAVNKKLKDKVSAAKIKLARRLIWDVVKRDFFAFLWIVAIAPFALLALARLQSAADPLLKEVPSWAPGLLISLFLLIQYVFLTSQKARATRLPAAMLFIAFILLLSIPGYSGRQILRALGIGGGIPVEFIVRTMQDKGTQLIAEKQAGCLISNLGGRIVISEFEQTSGDRCAGEQQSESRPHRSLAGVTIFSSTDVLRLYGHAAAGEHHD